MEAEIGYKESRRAVWEGIVAEWKGSDLSVSGFCKKHGYSKGNFFRWKKRFEAEGVLEKVERAGQCRREWSDIISDWRGSGMSVTDYCRAHGYSRSSFSSWRTHLQGSNKVQSRPKKDKFVSVEFTVPDKRPLRIVLGDDIEIKFGSDTDSRYLATVIEALQKVC